MSIRSRMWEKHEVNLSPAVRWALSVLLLLTALLLITSLAVVAQDQPAARRSRRRPRPPAPRPTHPRRKPQRKAPRPCGSWWASRC